MPRARGTPAVLPAPERMTELRQVDEGLVTAVTGDLWFCHQIDTCG
jgi:hypothetical protein